MKKIYFFGVMLWTFCNVAPAATPVISPALQSASVTTTSFTFSATLLTPLLKGESVKMDYGNGLKAMHCVEQACTLALTASKNLLSAESVDYTIGVYDVKKNVQGEVQTGTFSLPAMTITPDTLTQTPVSAMRVLAAVVKFTASLTAPLTKNDSVKIDYGKGLKIMTCSGKTCVLSSNVLPTQTTANYTIGLYKGSVRQYDTLSGSYHPASAPPPVTPSSYSKISNTGAVLEDSATQGLGETEWACTKDNQTGLIWEIKNTDKGLHNNIATYSWYDATVQGSAAKGKINGGVCYESRCDTESYKNAVNAAKHCGAENWRLPTRNELMRLIYCSDGNYSTLSSATGYVCTNGNVVTSPTINTTYFPHITQNYWVWTSTQDTISRSYALLVDFKVGYVDDYTKISANHVFLVHR